MNKTTIPMLSSLSQEHYTPFNIAEAIRRVFTVDLDPCSNEKANEIIQAKHFFSEDALSKEWFGNCYINPPGGRTGHKANVKEFWNKALSEYNKGKVDNFMFMFFSHEAMIFCDKAYDFTTCVFNKRLKFLYPDVNGFATGGSPAHASAMVLASSDPAINDRFIEVFNELGIILKRIK